MTDQDQTGSLRDQVEAAIADRRTLSIQGGNSKTFYGRAPQGEPFDVSTHRGIVHYEPTELVVTARAGTPLTEIEAALAEHNQMLGFEPPHFSDSATLGGTVACGLSGPRRPYSGSARDFVLGTRVLTGKAEVLRFGGEVMKNVAGYDVSRLMTGALGTLGAILEVSLKVLPRPALETTLAQECSMAEALTTLGSWYREPYPLSAVAHDGERLYLRLSGADSAVKSAVDTLGGETLEDADSFWHSLREQQHPFFTADGPLWRLSLLPTVPMPDISGRWLLEWGGAQRWLIATDADGADIQRTAARAGGHASLFRGGDRQGEVFHPLNAGLDQLHLNLKNSFDPHRLFNPGRLYADL